ncbi:AI-2E family transporter [Pseudemcibacter aquimaris]|uniref:AI-2E family transporter n=1 Tax=Pseudemcibacter aquimaris TaxID=2857064 RepID=UPI00201246A6|nr:AI-2E family transporter [Pseudemcibacter aquimaris]MCC3860289.1 AI-2E family transporter [Pseudemcibacter aquimaris]WDU57614.1 AI-2E family transporter [Pseudemcibacter aquimaris]
MGVLPYIGGLGLITLTVYIMVVGRDLIVPFLISVVIWYLINTLSDYYYKIKIGAFRFPKALCFITSLITTIVAIYLIVEMIGNNIADVRAAAPVYQENLLNLSDRVFNLLGIENQPNLSQLIGQIDLRPFISNIAGTMASIAGNAGLILIYVLFLFLEQASFSPKLEALLNGSKHSGTVQEIIHTIHEKIETYVAIKTFVSILTGTACYFVLLMNDVDYASFWAFIIFLLNYIPTVGSMLAVLFPALLSLVQFPTFTPFLIVLTSLVCIQVAVGNILEPKLMGNSLNLSPLVVMLSLAIWGSIWGVAGMFLSVPFTVILMIIFSEFPKTRPIAILLSQNGKIGTSKK